MARVLRWHFLHCFMWLWSLGCAHGASTIEPLPLSDVRLLDTALQARYEKLNAKYLLDMLEPDRLLWSFRKTSGLPTPGTPYIASWEDPGCELRGHFVGHYLSALSLALAGTGNSAFKTRLDLMVSELGKVQEKLGTGYLSAFPTEFFDRVEALKPVWAPYYTIHKIIAGLVDAHELAGHPSALAMATRMVDYHWNRTQVVIAAKGREHWNAVLNCEFGGMNEILYRMYRLTKNKMHMEFAQLFNKPFFRKPMEAGNDMLMNLHANTHLAQVAGFAEEYDTVGTPAARQATSNFFEIVTQHHSFATGGSTDHEFWQAPDELADSVLTQKHGVETQETCTQYNILKIARSLFRWTGDVRYADFYERALVNGILGTARLPPEDWPEHALPKRGRGGRHHHHHHHHHANQLRSGLLSMTGQQSQQGASELALTQLQAGGGAAGAGATGAMLVSPHRRQHNEEWLGWWAFAKPQPEWNASDAHGPGVFIYLLPLGTGQSKSDNIHHWGFPFHSFWCCYGTVIESYAKLADSIYFKEMAPANPESHLHDKAGVRLPPRLYVNQLVSSKATWAEMNLRVTMQADMFTPGPAAVAQLTLDSTKAPGPGTHDLGTFTLMVRVPEWLAPDRHGGVAQGGSGASIEVNGQLWTSCPGPVKAGGYCALTRRWASGDGVSLRVPMRWRLQSLAENRAQHQGLKAVMLGPFVMAGITHSDRGLTLPTAPAGTAAAAAGGGGSSGGAAPPVELRRRVYPPEESDELMSVQAGWNASLHLRHDANIAYVSQLEDGGDAMDATFRIGRGCHHGGDTQAGGGGGAGGSGHHGLLSQLHGRQSAAGGAAGDGDDVKSLAEEEGASHGSLAGAFSSLRSMMRLGAADSGAALSLEAMSYPNHYLAHDHTDVIVLQPGAAAGTNAAACSRAMWMMRPGLDGAADTVSFEAVARPGWFVTAAGPEQQAAEAAACHDAPGDQCHGGDGGPCGRDAYAARVLCRQFCGNCNVTGAALRLRQRPAGGPAAGGSFAAASSFRLAPPARRAYPAGSFVLAGLNRHYLVAPIGHLVDERYTAYFMVDTKSRGGPGGGGGGGRIGIKRGQRGSGSGEGGGL